MRWRRWGPERGPQKLLKVFGSICMRLGRGEKWLFLLTALWVHQVVSLRYFSPDLYWLTRTWTPGSTRPWEAGGVSELPVQLCLWSWTERERARARKK